MRPVILAAVILTVLAVLLGGGIGYLMSSSIEENIARKEKDAAAAATEPPMPTRYTGDIALVNIRPVTANLMSPETVFIRLEASMVLGRETAADAGAVSALSAEISQDILTFLSTLTLAQVQGPAGLQNLREDLNDRVAIRSAGKVHELILETMVVQ